jgi:hypothetical protein
VRLCVIACGCAGTIVCCGVCVGENLPGKAPIVYVINKAVLPDPFVPTTTHLMACIVGWLCGAAIKLFEPKKKLKTIVIASFWFIEGTVSFIELVL